MSAAKFFSRAYDFMRNPPEGLHERDHTKVYDAMKNAGVGDFFSGTVGDFVCRHPGVYAVTITFAGMYIAGWFRGGVIDGAFDRIDSLRKKSNAAKKSQ